VREIVPDATDGLLTDETRASGDVRAALHREWLPSCSGPWRDELTQRSAGRVPEGESWARP
jgi:hypothetical protein